MHTLIIGGGLSGLALAETLEAQGDDYLLIEARDRLGGRIKTEHHMGECFDIGPAWFWPGQPRIAALIARLGLETFDQYAAGILTYEDEQGQVQRRRGFASMQGSWRLKGGLGTLIDALAARIPEARKRLNTPVTALSYARNGITVTLSGGDTITADRAVMALPPRIAAEIAVTPALPPETMQAMRNIPTWMAGQAKAVAVYDTPFWRDAGLSGDAMSRTGPLVEIHDASPYEGGSSALFGFIGVPPHGRQDMGILRQRITAQLVRLFGEGAADPKQLFIKDWAFDCYTSTPADLEPLRAHPTYGLPQAMRAVWDSRLLFAGTEVAPEFGGYIEGALEAAELASKSLQR